MRILGQTTAENDRRKKAAFIIKGCSDFLLVPYFPVSFVDSCAVCMENHNSTGGMADPVAILFSDGFPDGVP